MDPLITNAVDPALIRVFEKRGAAGEAPPRRKPVRPVGRLPITAEDRAADTEAGEAAEEAAEDASSGEPNHALDDLA